MMVFTYFRFLLVGLLIVLVSGCQSDEAVNRNTSTSLISYDDLMGSTDRLFITDAFLPSPQARTAEHIFEGRLVISGTPQFELNYGNINSLPDGYQAWPVFDVEFVQDAGRLIPTDRSHSFKGDGAWSVTAGVGKVWQEASDNGFSRAAFPYTLKQNNTNCEANGVATFLFHSDQRVSNVHVQNIAETCYFYGFEFYGLLDAQYLPGSVLNKAEVIATRNQEENGFIATKPLSSLADDFSGVNLANYAYAMPSETLNGFGLFVNGVFYTDGCATRYGEHPYCTDKTIALYSFTKSIHAFLMVAAIEALYPGFRHELIQTWIPECADARWDNVTIENALDMATGNYQSAAYHQDESSSAIGSEYFPKTTQRERADFACNGWPKRVEPGTYSVYHTTDTELVGYAATAFLNAQLNNNAQSFDTVMVPFFEALNLSQYIQGSQRTTDTNAPWAGYGLSATLNDVMRIALYIRDQAPNDAFFDNAMIREVLTGKPQGLDANVANLNYDNGFWRLHVGATSTMRACGDDTQVPMMSGFGGHTLVILPNVIVMQFTDSGETGILRTIDDIFTNISNTCPDR